MDYVIVRTLNLHTRGGGNKKTGGDRDVVLEKDGKISWTDKISNEEVLRRVGEERHLMNLLRNRKKIWIGHVLRGEGLMREVIEGRMYGKRSRGRPRTKMFDDLMLYVSKRRLLMLYETESRE